MQFDPCQLRLSQQASSSSGHRETGHLVSIRSIRMERWRIESYLCPEKLYSNKSRASSCHHATFSENYIRPVYFGLIDLILSFIDMQDASGPSYEIDQQALCTRCPQANDCER
jgi:hypothetical protein